LPTGLPGPCGATSNPAPSTNAAISFSARTPPQYFASGITISTLAVQVDESLASERLLATLSGFFGGLALLLAMIELYGVMAYNVTCRRNEIGIRTALGAEPGRVLRMVMGEVALLIGIGLAIGLGAAVATARFIEAFSTGRRPNPEVGITLQA